MAVYGAGTAPRRGEGEGEAKGGDDAAPCVDDDGRLRIGMMGSDAMW